MGRSSVEVLVVDMNSVAGGHAVLAGGVAIDRQAELTEEVLESLLAESRDGYRHFQVSHQLVLERGYGCARCQYAQLPFSPLNSGESMRVQTRVCTNCHRSDPRSVCPTGYGLKQD